MAGPTHAVIGAGIVGLATAHALQEHGCDVRVYECGRPGNGQSGGAARIFRHAHDDPRLVAMAKRSRAVWREWERSLGTELVSADGVVALGEAALERLLVVESVGGVDARPIGPGELSDRLPVLAGYDGPAVLDSDGGAIRTIAAIGALSAKLGGALRTDEVLAIRPDGDGVEVRSGGDACRYDRVVVCAGRRTGALARMAGVRIPVEQAAHMRITFRVTDDPPERIACLQDGSGAFPETGVYAVAEPGCRRYAVGLSETTDAGGGEAVSDPGALRRLGERTIEYVRAALPGLDPEPADHRHCWVTALPWSDDGLGVWEAGGCLFPAGHNLYKLAPALGRDLAAAACGEGLREELRPESQLGSAEAGNGGEGA